MRLKRKSVKHLCKIMLNIINNANGWWCLVASSVTAKMGGVGGVLKAALIICKAVAS